ncbi:MAG: MPBQ/MSBQ methyltransferase [Candidatus Azotimanducaceae bacterium]|jgi:MPBQ/MSBQ methyltransferase
MGNREIGCSLITATYCAAASLGSLEDCGMSIDSVVSHYTHEEPIDRILASLRAAGFDLDALQPHDLSGVDEFHLGGRLATTELLKSVKLTAPSRLLDVGCGIGGAARTIAAATGCTVNGIDLTPSFVAAATQLSKLVGMTNHTTFDVATALDLPFDDATFDAVTVLHVGMNIDDKRALFAELARVLVDGGTLHVYDVMRIGDGNLTWPLPWSSDPSHSFVVRPDEYVAALESAGLHPRQPVNYIELVRTALAASQANPPTINLSHLMGPDWPTMFANLGGALAAGIVAPTEIVATK